MWFLHILRPIRGRPVDIIVASSENNSTPEQNISTNKADRYDLIDKVSRLTTSINVVMSSTS